MKLMIRSILTLIVLAWFGYIQTPIAAAYTPADFVITVDTTRPGSANNQYIFPAPDGGYDAVIDWGDGATTSLSGTPGNVTHTYAVPGTYEIVVTHNTPSGLPQFYCNYSGDGQKLIYIEQWGTSQFLRMVNAFEDCPNFNSIATDNPNTTSVTDMSAAFRNATSFNANINNWDVSNVVSMAGMFQGASSFNQPLDNWNVSNVANWTQMFWNATSFNQPLNSWDVSGGTVMSLMFAGASSFNQPLDNWDMSNKTDIWGMFWGAYSFNQDISSWNTSNLNRLWRTFSGASSFNQDISTWDVDSVTEFTEIFNYSGLSVENYSNILEGWSQQLVQSNQQLDAYGLFYRPSSQSARDILTDTHNWAITDSGIGFTLTYGTTTNMTFSGAALQVVASGTSGTSVTVFPDPGYRFVKWSDDVTDNPRTDSNVLNDIAVMPIIEVNSVIVEDERGSESTAVGMRDQMLKDLITTPVVTVTSFVSSVRNFLTYLITHEDELENLSPEESKTVIVTLRDMLLFLIQLLPVAIT